MAGLLAAIGFLQELGMPRVEARVRALRRRLRTAVESLPGVRVVTPADEALASGMLSFGLDGVDSLDLQAWLSRTANVRTRVIGEYDYGWMRLSTHVYNTEAEIDRVSDLLARAARSGVPGRTG